MSKQIPTCPQCGRDLGPRSYQKETGNWVATGKFPTFDFCSKECADKVPTPIMQRALEVAKILEENPPPPAALEASDEQKEQYLKLLQFFLEFMDRIQQIETDALQDMRKAIDKELKERRKGKPVIFP